MIVSEARIDANKRNSTRSTGPITPEGKAISRANSLKHGMSGDGIVVPIADLTRIGEVAEQLRNQYNPTTIEGHAMLDRAALMLVRLDRAGKIEVALVEDSVITAVADFDQFRLDWADNLFDGLETNPGAVDELQTFPEGIDRLIAEWTSFEGIEEWSPEDLTRLDRISDAGTCTQGVIRSLIPAEIGRLVDLKATINRKPIEAARRRAANLALFPTTREAILARRYEAATERAYHKAMQTYFETENEIGEIDQSPGLPHPPTHGTEMGSFSPAELPRSEPRPEPRSTQDSTPRVTPNPPVDRASRPDPRKMREAMKKKRR